MESARVAFFCVCSSEDVIQFEVVLRRAERKIRHRAVPREFVGHLCFFVLVALRSFFDCKAD